jgi:hypothetical protein
MKYDPATYLMIEICRKANPVECTFSAVFAGLRSHEINRLGSLLEFLGLAEESDKSDCDLDWLPNRRLMSIIAEQVVRPPQQGSKIDVSKDDRDFVESIYNLATAVPGESDDDGIKHFCFNVLVAFGLLEKGEGEDGDLAFKPTPRLKDLVLKRLLERVVKEQAEAEDGEDENE